MFGNASWKLHNRKLFEAFDQICAFAEVDGSQVLHIANGGVCDLDDPRREASIAAAACYHCLNTLIHAPLGSYVQPYSEKLAPSRKSEREKDKAIKRIYKNFNPVGAAQGSIFLALSVASASEAITESDPEFMDKAPYFRQLIDWTEEYIGNLWLDEDKQDILFALNITRNRQYFAWDEKCNRDGPTEVSDPTFIDFHNSCGANMALGLVMATSAETVRNTYVCQQLEGLSQEAIARSQSSAWDQFRSFLVPIHWKEAIARMNKLTVNNVTLDPEV